jgi:hypothetical protein
MIELYLIFVLGSLSIVSTIVAAISGIGFLISGITKQTFDPKNDAEDYQVSCNILRICKPIFFISILLSMLTPSKNQLYMIFGVGPVIDNIQESEVAKQLPDKTLQVLDRWCDSYLKSENNQN